MRKMLLMLALLISSELVLAQQEMIELARQDIRAGRMGMIAASMNLSPAQQEKFWPIYRDYADEQEKLLDQRITMLQEFAGNYEQMTEATAISIAEQSFQIQRARTERRERYFKRMSTALGPVMAARFIQVDSQLATLMDFEMMKNTPLIQPAAPTAQ
ncbi:MAG: hypothetical protein ABJ308_11585 [Halieaceae bacterium]